MRKGRKKGQGKNDRERLKGTQPYGRECDLKPRGDRKNPYR